MVSDFRLLEGLLEIRLTSGSVRWSFHLVQKLISPGAPGCPLVAGIIKEKQKKLDSKEKML